MKTVSTMFSKLLAGICIGWLTAVSQNSSILMVSHRFEHELSWKVTPQSAMRDVSGAHPEDRQHSHHPTMSLAGGRGSQNWYLNYGKHWSLVIVVNLINCENINAASSLSESVLLQCSLFEHLNRMREASLLFQSSIVKCFISDQTKEQQHNENWLSLGTPLLTI